jgi:hypothetical protein
MWGKWKYEKYGADGSSTKSVSPKLPIIRQCHQLLSANSTPIIIPSAFHLDNIASRQHRYVNNIVTWPGSNVKLSSS